MIDTDLTDLIPTGSTDHSPTEDLNCWWARRRGQPDPYLKIGQTDHGSRERNKLGAGGTNRRIQIFTWIRYNLIIHWPEATKCKLQEFQMKLIVSLDRDEDGIWIAECPSIPGCVSQGPTKEEALENVKEAIQLCLEARARTRTPPDNRNPPNRGLCLNFLI